MLPMYWLMLLVSASGFMLLVSSMTPFPLPLLGEIVEEPYEKGLDSFLST